MSDQWKSKFMEKFGENKNDIFLRRWALNCAVATFGRTEAVSAEAVVEVARQYEKYLRGE